MTTNFIDRQLLDQFKKREVLTRQDLFNFYHLYEPEMNNSAINWKIFNLKRRNLIETAKKGSYQLFTSGRFKPSLQKDIKSLGKILVTTFNQLPYIIWTTSWIGEFTELQAISSILILETHKSSVESVFFYLKDHGYKNIFIKPDKSVMENYVSELKESIIIKPMVTRSPTMEINRVIIPTLEKILVDLFCDEKIFFAFQGKQLVKIYQMAFEKYSINYSILYNYAKRRKRGEKLKEFLLENLFEKVKKFIE
ncbi:MAG: DUF6577 family protein [Chitinophagaceae bacterium]